jgi:peptidoglycan-N-acetylglucosamine deacetylase
VDVVPSTYGGTGFRPYRLARSRSRASFRIRRDFEELYAVPGDRAHLDFAVITPAGIALSGGASQDAPVQPGFGQPAAAVSIDLDSARTHLDGYRLPATGSDRLLDIAVPRFLERLGARSMLATFFVVARDLRSRPQWMREIVAAGHEIASHSSTHPAGIARKSTRDLRNELEGSRAAIEDGIGQAVRGFRAPNWDVSGRLLSLVCRAGYGYDASLLPTPLLIPARFVLAAKARSGAALVGMAPWPSSLRRLPHRVSTPAGRIVEIPVSVTPWSRWPVYHTLRHGMSDARFDTVLNGFVSRGEAISYPMHAIDAIGIDEDRIDSRLRRHPGGRSTLDEKLGVMDRTLDALGSRFSMGTLADLASMVPDGERAA